MRTVALAVVAGLVASLLAPARAEASTADLVRQLDGLVAAFPGGAGIWVSDPNVVRPLYAHDPEEQIVTASLYKLGVLAEAERRVEAGELRYGDRIVIQPEDITEDGSFEEPGTEMSLDAALEAMITVSDNGTAQALWHTLGGANINDTLTKAGIGNFHVALDRTEDNWATPHAVGTYFTLLAKRQLISPAASDRMLARLGRQQISDRLPAQLPGDVLVAHKTGNLPGLTHDAGIIYTRNGPRVVVAMTWDAIDDVADSFIASIGAIVYSAILEPAANASYQVAKSALSVDIDSKPRVTVPITNIGTRAWTLSGAGSVGLIWELRSKDGTLLTTSSRPQKLPALQPNQTQNVSIDLTVPKQPGTYTVTIGLTDVNGIALAYSGAATATFSVRAHRPYLVTAQISVPRALHRGEASLAVVDYTAAEGSIERTLSVSWRAIDPRTNRTVQQGASSVGSVKGGASGTLFVAFVAPTVLGTYRLAYELTEGGVVVSEPASKTVEITGPRTYPDDWGGRPFPIAEGLAAPTPAPRFEFPTVTIPKPSLPIELPLRRGKSPGPRSNP
ncbi:MAG TPA: serine hydrolase [Candidatus Limnocylindria bacterium]|nr:serine hydrolase [Candidatus Limnocylindria bacterium]